MEAGVGLLGGVLAVAAALYFSGRGLSRRRLMRGREPIAAEQILKDLPESISRDAASEVLQAVGKSFGIQPELLRLEDQMSALTAIDSWTLGKGQEELEDWLRSKGVESLRSKITTIRELILSVLQASR